MRGLLWLINPIGQLFYVEDASAETLAVAPGTERATMAFKDMGTWKSLYAVAADMSAAVYRAIAREAGVHIYNDRDDTFYANKTFVCLHANGAGSRTIQFPWACDVTDMMTGEPVSVNSNAYTRDFKNGETVILRWKTRL